ncbi:MAG: hypothetical protein JJ863_23985 [Deltaproteobacteria bacterium]|nr:hypothetical protein [Deltaproteobacteria bacterium]
MIDAFDAIRGQDAAVTALRRVVAQERIASAYLFEGPSGVGKEQAALALARAVIGEKAWPRIRSGAHPDVRIYRPRDEGHRNIRVEFLREEVLRHAEYAPFEGKNAFLIFPEADVSFPEIHPEAGNALLKTLEEPKAGVTFVLLAERPQRLLPTIRSRSQPLRFQRLDGSVVEAILMEHGIDEETAVIATALSGGRADKALWLAEEERAQQLFELAMRVDEVTADHRPDALVDVADELAKQEDLRAALEGLGAYYADLARAALGVPDEALAFRHEAGPIRRRGEKLGARRAAARVELLTTIFEDLDANANKGTAMDSLIFRLRTAR